MSKTYLCVWHNHYKHHISKDFSKTQFSLISRKYRVRFYRFTCIQERYPGLTRSSKRGWLKENCTASPSLVLLLYIYQSRPIPCSFSLRDSFQIVPPSQMILSIDHSLPHCTTTQPFILKKSLRQKKDILWGTKLLNVIQKVSFSHLILFFKGASPDYTVCVKVYPARGHIVPPAGS